LLWSDEKYKLYSNDFEDACGLKLLQAKRKTLF